MRLLIATGGSPHSEAALYLAGHILQKEEIFQIPTVVTVIRNKTECPQASQILARACEILLQANIEVVRTKTRIGDPTHEIISEIQEGGYDLVLVGERSTHGVLTRFLGSTATAVVEKAPCPIMIAKGKIASPQRILLCDSGASPSILSRLPAELVSLLEGGDDVTVLHVMSQMSASPRVSGEQLWADATALIQAKSPEGELLKEDTKTLTRLNITPNLKVRHGLVVDEIIKEADCGNYDLVVIGNYRGQGWGRLLLENLAYQVIVKIDRPILVVQ